MGKKSRRPTKRSIKIPPKALETGRRLMDEQAAATKRYNEWAQDSVAAMNVGDPQEGHQWLVDPSSGTVSELPTRK